MLGFDASSKMSVTSGSKINHSDPTESIVRLQGMGVREQNIVQLFR